MNKNLTFFKSMDINFLKKNSGISNNDFYDIERNLGYKFYNFSKISIMESTKQFLLNEQLKFKKRKRNIYNIL